MSVPLDDLPQGDQKPKVLCGLCGAENPLEAQICSRCGTPLPKALSPLPSWLASAAPSQSAPPAAGPIPHWLQTAPPTPSPVPPATPPTWLHTKGVPESPPPAPSTPAEIPEWLRELEEPAVEVPPVEEVELFAPSAEPPSLTGDEALDWLSGLFIAPAEEAAKPSGTEVQPQMPAEPPPSPPPLPTAGRPEWLPAEEAPSAEEIPAWLADLSEHTAETPAPTVAEPIAEAEIPEWLRELEAPPAEAPALSEAAPPEPAAEATPSGEERVEWAEVERGLEEGLAIEEVAPPLEGGDLLGLTSDLPAPPTEEELPLPPPVGGAELPEWLRGLHELGAAPEVSEPAGEGGRPDWLDQIRDLRYEAIVGEGEKPPLLGTEAVGALKDVAGVIQPELIFEGSSLQVGEPLQELVISDRQAEQIALLRRVLAREVQGVSVAPQRRWRVPLLRWLVALILIVAVAAPFLLNIAPLDPALAGQRPSTGVAEAYRTLENLRASPSVVLVAFEYEADTAAEMEPLALALLEHLAAQPATTVYTISTRPTGAAMADAVLHEERIRTLLGERTESWSNLGYLPARASGIYSLATGIAPITPLPSLSSGDIRLIIVLAARSDDLRIWVEQAGRPTGIPMLAATSASVAALAQPYRESGQLVAVLSGLNDAAAYQTFGGRQASAALAGRWNAQVLASGVAAALIVLGGLLYGLLSLRNRGEAAQ